MGDPAWACQACGRPVDQCLCPWRARCPYCGVEGRHECIAPGRFAQSPFADKLKPFVSAFTKKPPCARQDLHCYCEDAKVAEAGRKPHLRCCHCGHERAKP